jgi:hypothetical protein
MSVTAILGGVQAAAGIGQAVAGWVKKKNLTRPEYQIPDEIEKNMSEAELMSYYGMPDAQKQQYMQNIQRAGQQALAGVADRKGGLGMVSTIQQSQQDSYMSLLSADVQQRMQNIQAAQQQREVMAQFKDKAFEVNEMQPYQQSYAEAQALIGAGTQNFMGGLSTIAEGEMAKEGEETNDSGESNFEFKSGISLKDSLLISPSLNPFQSPAYGRYDFTNNFGRGYGPKQP